MTGATSPPSGSGDEIEGRATAATAGMRDAHGPRRSPGRTAGSEKRTDPAFTDRVQRSHAATRTTLRVALLFLLGAAVAAVAGPSPWLALHLFLAGGAALAISAVTVMLTVTWSAAPAPSARVLAVQRVCIAVGAAGVVLTREVDGLADWSTGIPGALYLVGLVMLVGLLIGTVRQGQERRFDVAVAFYVAALLAALAGVGAGIAMATSGVTMELRSTHVVLNLLGFIGLTMAGSLPFFASTVGRSRMSPAATPFRLAVLLGAMVAALGVTVVGVVTTVEGLAFTGLGAYLYGIVAVYCFMPKPTKRQLEWAGPRVIALWCAGAWWVLALGVTAYELIAKDTPPFTGRWTQVLVIGAYAQILWGSLAYLIPMLRGGGHHKLSEGFAQMKSWLGLAGLNAAALAFAFGATTVGVAMVAVTVIDGVWRTFQVGLRQAARPEARTEARIDETSEGRAGARVGPARGSAARSVEPGAV